MLLRNRAIWCQRKFTRCRPSRRLRATEAQSNFSTRVSRFIYSHPKSLPIGERTVGGNGGFWPMKRTGGGNAKPSQLPVAGGQKSPVVVSPAGQHWHGSHQAHGWARVPGTARLWFAGSKGRCPLVRVPQGRNAFVSGVRGRIAPWPDNVRR